MFLFSLVFFNMSLCFSTEIMLLFFFFVIVLLFLGFNFVLLGTTCTGIFCLLCTLSFDKIDNNITVFTIMLISFTTISTWGNSAPINTHANKNLRSVPKGVKHPH